MRAGSIAEQITALCPAAQRPLTLAGQVAALHAAVQQRQAEATARRAHERIKWEAYRQRRMQSPYFAEQLAATERLRQLALRMATTMPTSIAAITRESGVADRAVRKAVDTLLREGLLMLYGVSARHTRLFSTTPAGQQALAASTKEH